MDRGPLTMAWYAVMTAFFYLYFAAFLALAYGTVNALIGIVLSVIVYSLVNIAIVRAASRSGLTVALFSRSMFGFVGAASRRSSSPRPAIYYTVFEGSVIAVAAQTLIGGPIKLWYAVVILLTGPLVWKGVRVWLDRLNTWLLPFYIVGMVAVVVWALADNGYHGFLPDAEAAPGTTLPWLQAFAAYMGLWILMMFTFDFARLAKPSDEKYHVTVTFGWLYYTLTFLVNGLLGILLVSTFGITFEELAGQESALPVTIVNLTDVLGLGLIVDHADAHQHGEPVPGVDEPAGLLLARFGLNLSRTVWVVVAGAAVVPLMLTNVFSYVLDALNYQGIAIVAWVGVALAHVLYLRRARSRRGVRGVPPGPDPGVQPRRHRGLGVGHARRGHPEDRGLHREPVLRASRAAADVRDRLRVYTVTLASAKASWFAMARPNDPALEVADPARPASAATLRPLLHRAGDGPRPHRRSPGDLRGVRDEPAFYRAAREEAKRFSPPTEREVVGA